MLKKKVLVEKITNLSDARYCAGMMVDYLSFPTNSEVLSKEQFSEICNWVSGVSIYGEIDASQDIEEVVEAFALSNILVKDPSLLSKTTLKAGLELDFNSNELPDVLDENAKRVDFFIISIKNPLTAQGQKQLEEYCSKYPILLKGDLDLENLVLNENLTGFCFQGTAEERPGFKNYDDLADSLELLEIEY